MKTNLFKFNTISLFIIGLFLSIFYPSCNESENSESYIQESDYKAIAKSSEQKWQEVRNLLSESVTRGTEVSASGYQSPELVQALDLLMHSDFEHVCQEFGINPLIYDAVIYYIEHISDQSVFEDLESRFPSLTNKEIEQMFDSYFLSEYIMNDYLSTGSETRSYVLDEASNDLSPEQATDDYLFSHKVDCIATTAIVAVGVGSAVFVTGGASLAFFLIGYSGGIFGIISTCNED